MVDTFDLALEDKAMVPGFSHHIELSLNPLLVLLTRYRLWELVFFSSFIIYIPYHIDRSCKFSFVDLTVLY